jgi:hypothetical protein
MNTLISTLYAFLPQRYRDVFTPYGVPPVGALLGGILEALICGCFLMTRYYAFMDARLAAIPLSVMVEAGKQGGETAIMGLGHVLLIEYLIQFTTLALVFLTFEGFVRVFAAIGGGETLPSLPLYALALLHTRLEADGRELRLGKRIPDEAHLTSSGESLQIASCRPKPWTQLTTVVYRGECFELIRTHKGTPPRPFMHLLRKKPVCGVIRNLYIYDPDEVAQSKN